MSITKAVTEFIVAEYLPGTSPDELDSSYELLDTGVVDSLRLVQLIEWVAVRYDIRIDEVELSPENFRSVDAIREFVETNQKGLEGEG